MTNREGPSSPSVLKYLTHRPHFRVMHLAGLDWLILSGKHDSVYLEEFLSF
jgi:hypothetical protein